MRDDFGRLQDMIEAINKIESHVGQDRDAFFDDEMLQVWVIHHLQVLGEAANRLSGEIRAANPDVPWSEIIGMRHILVHNYFGIDLERVWLVVEDDLPELKPKVERITRLLTDD